MSASSVYFVVALEEKNDGPNEAEAEASADHFFLLSVFCIDLTSFDDTACVSALLSLEEPQGTKGYTRHCSHGSHLRRSY
ncbi:hypothetical protein Bca4012_065591 [Brassica carinata]